MENKRKLTNIRLETELIQQISLTNLDLKRRRIVLPSYWQSSGTQKTDISTQDASRLKVQLIFFGGVL